MARQNVPPVETRSETEQNQGKHHKGIKLFLINNINKKQIKWHAMCYKGKHYE